MTRRNGRHRAGEWSQTHPEIYAQWDFDRNDVDPLSLTAGAHRRVWWKGCPKDERHRWHSELKSRTLAGQGCAVCRGTQILPGINDLATRFPDVAAQWHPGNTAKPSEVAPKSRMIVSWTNCSVDTRHVWRASIDSRTERAAGCTVCLGQTIMPGINDLSTIRPDIASQWASENSSSPTSYSTTSGAKVAWQCPEGHLWEATIANRTSVGTGCPVCSNRIILPGFNDLRSGSPAVAAEWDSARNLLTPEEVSDCSSVSAWWVCRKGHSWQSTVYSRTRRGANCRLCQGWSSAPEQFMRECLSLYSYEAKFSIDSAEHLPTRSDDWGNAWVDAAGRLVRAPQRIIVAEYDGAYFHQGTRWYTDIRKTIALLNSGYFVVRFRGQSRNHRCEPFDFTSERLLLIDVDESDWRRSLESAVEPMDRWLETFDL